MRMKRAVYALATFLFPHLLHAAYQTTCYDRNDFSIDNQKICVTQDPGDETEYVIYFFHGLNASPDDMGKGKMLSYINEYFGKHLPGRKPAIIGYSLGKRTNLALPGRLQKLMKDVFPQIEADNLHFIPKARAAMGVSMGAWNLFHLQMADTSYFTKSALLCPAIASIHPWSSKEEISAYRKRTGAGWFPVTMMLQGVSDSYGGKQDLFMPFDPFPLLKAHRGPIGDLYISAEEQDEFGFQEGAAHLRDVAKAKGSSVEWHLRAGGHCKSQKMHEIIEFLTLKS